MPAVALAGPMSAFARIRSDVPPGLTKKLVGATRRILTQTGYLWRLFLKVASLRRRQGQRARVRLGGHSPQHAYAAKVVELQARDKSANIFARTVGEENRTNEHRADRSIY